MRNLLMLATLSALTACYSQEDFNGDYDEAWCERYLSCTDPAVLEFAPYDDVSSCVSYRSDAFEEDSACTLDRSVARDCVKALSEQSCDDFNRGSRVEACEDTCVADE